MEVGHEEAAKYQHMNIIMASIKARVTSDAEMTDFIIKSSLDIGSKLSANGAHPPQPETHPST
ncbi:hypothetical protein LINGRAHAP2_LOCUS34754, partial [Linum grandiflorum]